MSEPAIPEFNPILFILLLEGLYWFGVLSDRLSPVKYTNGNMDTFIHGGLATWGLLIISRMVVSWVRK